MVRVNASSLFHDEKFAFFDFGVRGTPKILMILLGVSLLPGAVNGFCPAGAAERRRQKPFTATGNSGTPIRIIKILWVSLTPKS